MVEQLAVVDDLEVAAERGVLVREGVETVRATGDDLFRAHPFEDLDIGAGLLLVEVLIAEAPSRVTGAALLRPEDGEAHPGPVQHAGGRLRPFASPFVERARAPHPVEVLDVVGDGPGDDRDLEVERVGPVGALGGTETPGVALVLDVAQHGARLGREARLDQDLVAAHVDDGVHVLDVDRALLDAGTARRA